MPAKLPKLIKLLTSKVPADFKAAVAMAVFPALAAVQAQTEGSGRPAVQSGYSAAGLESRSEVENALANSSYKPSQIEVVVHPQSVIHSMVQFEDGAVKAQLGMPDMRLPIQYAFSYPDRISSSFDRLDFSQCTNLTFEQPDTKRFRNLALAYEAMYRGGNMPCIVNAANEVVVASFLKDGISFLGMSDVIEKTMERVAFIANPTYDDYVATDAEARKIAASLI